MTDVSVLGIGETVEKDVKNMENKNGIWLPSLSPKNQEKLNHTPKKWIKAFIERWIQAIKAATVIIPILGITWGVTQFYLQQQNEYKRALDQQYQSTLQNYLDHMSDLLLKCHLLDSKPKDIVRKIALAQTLAALENLNNSRKSILVDFLYESDLISSNPPILNLRDADLSYVDLSDTSFKAINLSNAYLENVNLNNCGLNDANLSAADLSGANLGNVDLIKANLKDANLSNADLSNADLSNADLSNADLSNADLSGANLKGAHGITSAQLNQAKSLHDTTMPDGSKHQ